MSNTGQKGVDRSSSPVLDFNNKFTNEDDTNTENDEDQTVEDETKSGELTKKKGTGKDSLKRAKLRLTIDKLSAENLRLKEKIAAFEKTQLSATDQQTNFTSHYEDTKRFKLEKTELEQKLEKTEKSLKIAQEKISALGKSMESLNDQIVQVTRSKDEFAESKHTLEAKVQELTNEITQKTSENEKVKEYKKQIDILKKEKQSHEDSIQSLQREITKGNNDIQAKEREYEKLKKTSQQRAREYEEDKKRKNEKITEMEITRANDKSEIKRLEEYEIVCPALQKELDTAEQKIKTCNDIIQSVKSEKQKILEEKQELVLRLSRVAGANLVLNNPNIADLSDEKRPTKLAEEFSELYDNQWTDAFETIKNDDEKETTTFLLNLLKRANEICHKLSNEHAHSIKKGLCSFTLQTSGPIKKANATELKKDEDENKHTDMDVDTEQLPDNPVSEINTDKVDDDKANDDEDDNKMADQKPNDDKNPPKEDGHTNPEDDLKSQTNNPDENSHSNNLTASNCSVKANEFTFADSMQEGVNKKPHVKVIEVEFKFDDLHSEQKKTVFELRKFIEINLADKLELAAVDAIASENDLDPGKSKQIINYIKQCFNICWSMCQHDPPVFISFPEITATQKYDTNVYKPYTKTGKYLDFIVWPAVYLHEDGPLLCKGVAQGKN